MPYALIMAGGAGTRLWPMSRAATPKQLIPFIAGKSLLRIAWDRLDGVVPPEQRFVCAGLKHRDAILSALGDAGLDPSRYLGEPEGRDTLNAVGFGAAVVARQDPDAVIAVFTADHLIEPADRFRQIVEHGYALAESNASTLVTFGVTPTHAATGYGYLELGEPIEGASDSGARVVTQFKEKPDADTAQGYLDAGPDRYLWNSGMFVWRAATLMDCIARYEPGVHEGLTKLADAWDGSARDATLAEVYPTLKKISVDFAVMEPASRDEQITVAAIPAPLTWLDVGSWPAFAKTCEPDADGNAPAAARHALVNTRNTLVATSDPDHLIATIGCDDLVIIHTPDATLVCHKDHAEQIKQMHQLVGERFGDELL